MNGLNYWSSIQKCDLRKKALEARFGSFKSDKGNQSIITFIPFEKSNLQC